MKIIYILIFIFISCKVYAIEDSCLSFEDWPNCPNLGYFNGYFDKIDTCDPQRPWYSKVYNLIFNEDVFHLPSYPYDTLLIITYEQIDSIWKKIPQKFEKMKENFSYLYYKVGRFYLKKEYPNEIDTSILATKSFKLIFEDYQNCDSISLFFTNNDANIYSFFHLGATKYPEALRVKLEFVGRKHFPEIRIYTPQGQSWFWEGKPIFEIYRKEYVEESYALIRSIELKENWPPFKYDSIYIDSSAYDINATYFYKAKVQCSPFSNIVTTRMVNSIADYTPLQDALLSPNPATDYIEISGINPPANRWAKDRIRIYNALGEIVLFVGTRHALPLRVDVSGLPPGLYFVRLGNITRKFIKI